MKEYATDLENALNNIENKISRRAKLVNKEMYDNKYMLNKMSIRAKLDFIAKAEKEYRERSRQTTMFDEPQG